MLRDQDNINWGNDYVATPLGTKQIYCDGFVIPIVIIIMRIIIMGIRNNNNNVASIDATND